MAVRKSHLIGFNLTVLAGLCLAAFQNCGELRPSDGAVFLQSFTEIRDKQDAAFLKELVGTETMKLWISARELKYELPSVVAAETKSIHELGTKLLASSVGNGPRIVKPSHLQNSVYEFSGTRSLKSELTDDSFTEEKYSFVALIEAPISGRIVSVNGNGFADKEMAISIKDGKIRAVRESSANNIAWKEKALEPGGGPVVVAASFGKAGNSVTFLVNGLKVEELKTTGTALDNDFLFRQMIIGDPTADANFRLAELMVFKKELSAAQLNTLSRHIAKGFGYEGVVYDPTLDGGTKPPEPVDPVFLELKELVKNSCGECHSSYIVSSAAAWVDQGIVIKGDANNSKLYARLTGSDSTAGLNKNMPLTGSAFTPEQLTALKNYINALK